ncbi:hypothetical protein JCM16303_003010 [Sporobolomyces ruberrimus]
MVALHALLSTVDPSSSSSSTPRTTSPRRQALPPAPTLCSPLPEFANLEKTALQEARLAQRQHLLNEAVNSPLVLPEDAHSVPSQDLAHPDSTLPAGSSTSGGGVGSGTGKGKGGGNYEPFQVLRAIEKKDVMLLHEIKGSQFDLLISGNPLPIVYSMRLGKTHQDISILLIGAMSRKVNDVTDDELAMMDSSTKATLRSLRASLKIAITTSLSNSSLSSQLYDTSLIASFLQVVIMSEGSRWLLNSTQTLSLAFRTGPTAKPIETAEKVMLKWVSRELKEAQVSTVGDYVANGIWDLSILGMWSVVLDQMGKEVEGLPLYFFGRDDRMLKAVEERIALLKQKGNYMKLSRSIRNQLETSIEILGQRKVNGRERVEKLKEALDA